MRNIIRTYCSDSLAARVEAQLKAEGIPVTSHNTMSNGFHATRVTATIEGIGRVKKTNAALKIMDGLNVVRI